MLIVSCVFILSALSFVQSTKDLGTVIGIDLGTTYSCVGIFKNCHVEIIENDQGNRITPSCVGFTPDGERLIGDAAKNLLTSNPENTIFQIKRLMGRKFNDSAVRDDIEHFPFTVIERRGNPVVKVDTRHGEKLFTPEEISAMILGKMRDTAEMYLRTKVKHAVVTVPAYFNDGQRQATKDAGAIAGLNVIRIINEPTAAAIAYGLAKLNEEAGEKNVLVYDLGGGTFDVSLLTLDNGVFQVLATNGDTHLGGEDFDQRIVNYFIEIFKKKTNHDVRLQTRSIEKLRREAEKSKRLLSSEHQVKLEIESFYQNLDFSETLTRAKFEEINMDLFRATMVPVSNVMKDAKLKKSDIAEVLLVGGSTRIPKIRQLLKQYFDGREPARSINPDEAVAYGAAIQAGILSGERCAQDIVVIDVNPLTMGIEVKDGMMSEIIPRNREIPITQKKPFTTTTDFQEVVSIQVFEGERAKTKDNHFLGKFELTGIKPALRGVPEIEVTFDIDVDGILNVTAEEKNQNNKKNILINSKTNRLSRQDIDRMIRDSSIFAEDDKKVKERTEAKNELESYTYSLRNQLNDPMTVFGQLASTNKETLRKAIEQQIKWLDSNSGSTTNEFQKQKKLMQQAVIRTMTQANNNGENDFNDTDTYTFGRRQDL